MGKLHELLAVEGELAAGAAKIRQETAKLFSSAVAFNGSHTVVQPFNEADAHLCGEEFEELVTTVMGRLTYQAEFEAKWLDALLQKEAANQIAKADIVVDGLLIARDVPATMLLGLETRLRSISEVFAMMPTRDAKMAWDEAEDLGPHIACSSHPDVKIRTKKVVEPVVLYEATKEHPAQVKELSKDIPWAKVIKNFFTGSVTAIRKATILSNLDALIRAVKQARQRANTVDVPKVEIGKALMNFILH